MKKISSLTLATLAMAAISVSAHAYSPCEVPHYEAPGSGFSMELDLNWTEFGNGFTDFLVQTNPDTAEPFLLGPVDATHYSHNLSHDFNAGGRLAYTMGERTFVLKGQSFETDHRAPRVSAVAGSLWYVPAANMSFGGVYVQPANPITAAEAISSQLSTIATANDFIDSRYMVSEDRVQLGINRKIHLSHDHNFAANWEMGLIYLKGERLKEDTWVNEDTAVPAFIQHQDYTKEEFDGYGVYFGVSGHSLPFGSIPCLSLFGQAELGYVWADNEFMYRHQAGASASSAAPVTLADIGLRTTINTSSLLANVKLRTGLGMAKSFSTFRLGGSVYVDYSNTINAFKSGNVELRDPEYRTPGRRDLQHYSIGLTLAAAFGDGVFSFETT